MPGFLDKAKKPSKKKHEFDLSELSESGDAASEQAGESEGEMGAEPEAALAPSNPALEEASDEELMAEMQRRGLSSGMESPEQEESDMMDSEY